MKITTFAILCSISLLCACTPPKIEDYAANAPKMDIREFFDGDVKAFGVFFSRSGKADSQFTIDMRGDWNGNDGTLREHFVYNDGHTQDRMWNIHVADDHHLTATADDVNGTAEGSFYGNALNMQYNINLQSKDGTMGPAVDANDWIFQMDDKTGINRIQINKYGFNVGELVITFQKL